MQCRLAKRIEANRKMKMGVGTFKDTFKMDKTSSKGWVSLIGAFICAITCVNFNATDKETMVRGKKE